MKGGYCPERAALADPGHAATRAEIGWQTDSQHLGRLPCRAPIGSDIPDPCRRCRAQRQLSDRPALWQAHRLAAERPRRGFGDRGDTRAHVSGRRARGDSHGGGHHLFPAERAAHAPAVRCRLSPPAPSGRHQRLTPIASTCRRPHRPAGAPTCAISLRKYQGQDASFGSSAVSAASSTGAVLFLSGGTARSA
jgi:hypothetical protein